MASKPGILTEWPWTFLGNFKYLVLAPFVAHSIYTYFMSKDESQRDLVYIIILPLLLSRVIHNQIWISLSRYRTAKGNNRIVDKSIEFDQVDRESNWDDQIILNGLLYYIACLMLEQAHHPPLWRTSLLLRCFILVLSSFSITGFTELCTTIFSTLVTIPITTLPLLLSPSLL